MSITEGKLYPSTGAYKRQEFAPLPTLAKAELSVPCSGVEEIPSSGRFSELFLWI